MEGGARAKGPVWPNQVLGTEEGSRVSFLLRPFGSIPRMKTCGGTASRGPDP